MKSSERGSVTIWMLGLTAVLILFGGLALDYWRGLALQRSLAAAADSAAIAAASGIDEEHYRATGEVRLDEVRSRQLAQQSLARQDVALSADEVVVGNDAVEVRLEARLSLGLLGVFVDQSEPLLVRASSAASPRLVP